MFVKIILFPISFLYGCVLAIRNFLFSVGIKKSVRFPIPVLCVGNITVGGTGKTPFVEFLVDALRASNKRVAVLSRGYRRKTKGWFLANEKSTAIDIGDEPLQIKQKYPWATVAVCEKRVEGIERLLQLDGVPEVVILDDAFQHRAVKPSFSVLLMDYNRPLWRDTPFPGGRLREFARGRKRADLLIVTKCPINLTLSEKQQISKRLQPLLPHQIFFSHIEYTFPKPLFSISVLTPGQAIVVVTGIAVSSPFVQYLAQQYQVVKHLSFADHYQFSAQDIEQMVADAQLLQAAIVTTEKDAVRLQSFVLSFRKTSVWYIPIGIVVDRKEDLLHEITKAIT